MLNNSENLLEKCHELKSLINIALSMKMITSNMWLKFALPYTSFFAGSSVPLNNGRNYVITIVISAILLPNLETRLYDGSES